MHFEFVKYFFCFFTVFYSALHYPLCCAKKMVIVLCLPGSILRGSDSPSVVQQKPAKNARKSFKNSLTFISCRDKIGEPHRMGSSGVSICARLKSESANNKVGEKEMKAIIVTGGKQYVVAEGDVLYIEKLEAEAEATVKFEQVLAVLDGENSKIGAPVVEGAAVEAKVIKNGKAKKITVFKYKAKKNEKKKQGHRQPYTKVEITKIAL